MVFALQSVSCLDMGRNKLPLAISIHFLYKSLLIGSQLFLFVRYLPSPTVTGHPPHLSTLSCVMATKPMTQLCNNVRNVKKKCNLNDRSELVLLLATFGLLCSDGTLTVLLPSGCDGGGGGGGNT